MVMDAYCGIGAWNKRDRFMPCEPEETLTLMDRFAIDRALVYPNFVRGLGAPEHAVEMLARFCKNEPRFEPLVPLFPHAYPDMPSADAQFDRMRAMGARAAFCSFPNFTTVLPLVFGDIFARCEKACIPVLLEESAVPAERLDALCGLYPDLRIIYAGASYTADTWLFPLLRKHRNVWVVIGPGYIPPWGPMRFVESFGAGRLLFGSGLPETTPGGIVAHVSYATLSPKEKADIMGGNLERLLSEAWQ